MAALGFDTQSTIVAYDDAGGSIAARLWWMLDDLGHRDVHVLDGGIGAWTAIGGPLTTAVPDHPARTAAARGPLVADDRPRRARRAPGRASPSIDARAPERYRGDVEPVDGVAGHIPTAVNRPAGGNLGPDGRFLAPEALRLRFGPLRDEVVTSCGSGVTACQTALAMRIAGLPDPRLYAGSYSDWTRAGMPVVTGEEPGSA